MRRFTRSLLVTLTFLLTACASAPVSPVPPAASSLPPATSTDNPALLPTLFPNTANNNDLARIDEQGMVVFEVTPQNLGLPADTLDFEVSMNTHSIDLSMNLAPLATLTTDTGVTLQAVKWDATPGGHHVSGTLIFPATQNNKSLLEGATKLILTIVNVDAAARVFEWELK